MKRIYLLLTSLIFLCGGMGAQTDKIIFNETEHDFGAIGEKDGVAGFEFIFTNNSKAPVVVTKVLTSCGCTTPIWTKEPVEPGKQGKIDVSYNPLGRPNAFVKTISVYFDQSAPVYLRIKGVVEPGKKNLPPEEAYPVALGDYLLKSKDLDFGTVGLNGTKTIRLEAFNNSGAPVAQKIMKLPKYLSVTFNPVVIPAKTAGTIDVNFNAQDENSYGNLSGNISIMLNNVQQSFAYSASVLDDFSQWTSEKKTNAGRINVSASEIDFGDFSSGSGKTLKISNSGKSVLNVRAVQSSDPAVSVSKTRFIVNPGEIAEIKVNAENKKIQSNAFSSKLTIVTDDPLKPVYEIIVTANKKL